jgi:hypothetical protein
VNNLFFEQKKFIKGKRNFSCNEGKENIADKKPLPLSALGIVATPQAATGLR